MAGAMFSPNIYCLLLVFLLSHIADASERLQDVDLWLPKAFQKHYMLLVKAAEKAQDDPYCYKLLSGRLMEKQSTLEHMRFHFRCRSEDNKMFWLQIDGNSFAVTNEYKALASRIEAAKKAQQGRYWAVCLPVIEQRLEAFNEAEIISTDLPPKPIIQGDNLIFSLNFDAKAQSGTPLNFVVHCEISGVDQYKVRIVGRRSHQSD